MIFCILCGCIWKNISSKYFVQYLSYISRHHLHDMVRDGLMMIHVTCIRFNAFFCLYKIFYMDFFLCVFNIYIFGPINCDFFPLFVYSCFFFFGGWWSDKCCFCSLISFPIYLASVQTFPNRPRASMLPHSRRNSRSRNNLP